MIIEVAEQAGYCYGVERALNLATEALEGKAQPIQSIGPLIHNPQVVKSLLEKGIRSVKSIAEIKSGTVIIRSHGIDPKVIEKARNRNLVIVDATCPFVKKAQQRASRLIAEENQVFIIGERNHPEVVGIVAYTKGKGIVIESLSDFEGIEIKQKVGLVTQTTQSNEKLQEVVNYLVPRVMELKVYNTICHATFERQEAAKKLATKADIMLVVGGKNSANTNRLAQICREAGTDTYHIETSEDIDPKWLSKDSYIGITAGASTPKEILDEIIDYLNRLEFD